MPHAMSVSIITMFTMTFGLLSIICCYNSNLTAIKHWLVVLLQIAIRLSLDINWQICNQICNSTTKKHQQQNKKLLFSYKTCQKWKWHLNNI